MIIKIHHHPWQRNRSLLLTQKHTLSSSRIGLVSCHNLIRKSQTSHSSRPLIKSRLRWERNRQLTNLHVSARSPLITTTTRCINIKRNVPRCKISLNTKTWHHRIANIKSPKCTRKVSKLITTIWTPWLTRKLCLLSWKALLALKIRGRSREMRRMKFCTL